MRMSDLPPWIAKESSGLCRAYGGSAFVRNEDLAEWLVYFIARFGWRTPQECRLVRDMLIREYPCGPFQQFVWFFRRMLKI